MGTPTLTELARNVYGLPLAQARRLIGVHPATGSRWILEGRLMRDSTRKRLAATRTPGGWRVRPEDLDAFLQAITADRLSRPADPASLPRSPAQARREHAAAERTLTSAGF